MKRKVLSNVYYALLILPWVKNKLKDTIKTRYLIPEALAGGKLQRKYIECAVSFMEHLYLKITWLFLLTFNFIVGYTCSNFKYNKKKLCKKSDCTIFTPYAIPSCEANLKCFNASIGKYHCLTDVPEVSGKLRLLMTRKWVRELIQ